MRNITTAYLQIIAAGTLAACGGGGDSGSPAAVQHTESHVRTAAQLGVSVEELTGGHMSPVGGFGGPFLQQLSSDNGGSRTPPNFSCAINGAGSGSGTSTITKSAVRQGFAAGDSITVVYNNCDFGGTGTVLNGTWKMAAQGAIVNQSSASYQSDYQSSFTGFSMSDGTSTIRLTGTANFVNTQNSGSTFTFTVPAGQVLAATVSNPGGTMGMTYAAGTSFSGFTASSPNSVTRKLDGSVSVSVAGSSATILFATPVVLAGSLNSAGKLIPTSGVFNAKLDDLQTSLSVNGTNVTVSGDTDANGSLDLTITTTWAALLGL